MGKIAMEVGKAMSILIKKNQLRISPKLTSSYGSHASRGNSVGDAPASRTAGRFRLHFHAKLRNDAKRQNVGWVEQSEAQQNQIVGLHYIQYNLPFTTISRSEISRELALTTSGVML